MSSIPIRQFALFFLFCLLGTACNAHNPYLDKDTAEVILALKSVHAEERREAAEALRIRGPEAESAIPVLTEVLFDQDENVRMAARDALIAIGPKAVGPLLEACHRAPDDIASFICDGIHLFEPNAIPGFVEIYNENVVGSVERFAVVSGLDSMVARVGPRAVDAAPTLVSALDDPLTQQIAKSALRNLGKPAIPSLIQGLGNPDSDVRYYCAVILGQIGPDAQDAGSALSRALDDPVAGVRAAAQMALEKIGIATDRTPSPSERLDDLSAALRDPSPAIRIAAAEELGKLGPKARDALPALWQALQDPSPQVRQAVEEAIKKIQGSPG